MGFCYQKNFFNPTLPVDEAQFWALVRATKWKETIDRFRETGDQKLKRGLPAFIFQATFDETESPKGKVGRWRKQSATRLTGLVVMDIDHVDDPKAVAEKWTELDAKGIVLVYITPSGKGLKVVFKADASKGNLIDNQHDMAKVLGVEVDESCKDASRMSFICKEEDILYIHKELFTYENKEFAERYDDLYRDGHSQGSKQGDWQGDTQGTGTAVLRKLRTDESQSPCVESDESQSPSVESPCVESPSVEERPNFKGRAYSEIIEEWWKRNGGEPQEGERNVKLYQLAVNLRAICDNDKALLLKVMPRLGLEESEVKSIVESACKEPVKGISKTLREIIGLGTSAGLADDDMAQRLWEWGEQIEALSEDFPLLKDICKGLKKNQYPAALFVAGGLLMTLMTRCWYRFYHSPEEHRRLNCSVLVIGDPASGKSFATELYTLFSAPIVTADKAGLAAINRWKEETEAKGANKDKSVRPKAIVRIHPSRTSNATFIQDMVNAVEEVDGEPMQLHMLTFDTELDNSIQNQKGGSWIDKQSMELKAFHNEEDGQAYSNKGSVQQNFFVTWNYIYTGTPLALKRKVNERNFGSGLATRLTCVPLPPTNFEMMEMQEFRTFDHERSSRMKEWAFKLDTVKGELPLWPVVKRLYDWTARRMADAKENDSKADEMLLKRCAYHGLNFSAPFIVMRHWQSFHQDGRCWHGEFEVDETDWRLAELLVNIQYACQRYFFGAMAEKYFDDMTSDAIANRRHHQKTVAGYNRLPEEFTIDDVMRCFDLPRGNTAEVKLKRLKDDHLIERIGSDKSKAKYRKINQMMI